MALNEAYPGAYRDLKNGFRPTQLLVEYLGKLSFASLIKLGSSKRKDYYPDHRNGAVDLMTTNKAVHKMVTDSVVSLHHLGLVKVVSIISWGRIYSPGRGWRPYNGSSPHKDHVHVWIDKTYGFKGQGQTAHISDAFTLPAGHYYGPISGPVSSHGGGVKSDRDEIKRVQALLRREGYNIGPSGIDGIFGDDTRKAVKAWQRDNGFKGKDVDGLVGVKTWNKMF